MDSVKPFWTISTFIEVHVKANMCILLLNFILGAIERCVHVIIQPETKMTAQRSISVARECSVMSFEAMATHFLLRYPQNLPIWIILQQQWFLKRHVIGFVDREVRGIERGWKSSRIKHECDPMLTNLISNR